MLNFHDRRTVEELFSRMGTHAPETLKEYADWLSHPTTRKMALVLETLRERDAALARSPSPDGVSAAVRLLASGASASVWDAVYTALFDLPSYAAALRPAARGDALSRPEDLNEETLPEK